MSGPYIASIWYGFLSLLYVVLLPTIADIHNILTLVDSCLIGNQTTTAPRFYILQIQDL